MTKCSTEISHNLKTLLKILTCLWNQYVVNNIPYTQTYQANPNEFNYNNMIVELDSIYSLISNNQILNNLKNHCEEDVEKFVFTSLVVSNANGDVQYMNSNDCSGNQNSWVNAVTNNIASKISGDKYIVRLNNDECLKTSYQISPFVLNCDGNFTPATKAIISSRSGCAGIANTGFVSLALYVNPECYPVPSCIKSFCC
jgi:hypothetical protein